MLKLVSLSIFADVAIIITNHLDEESLGRRLTFFLVRQHVVLDDANDALAIFHELRLD